MIQIRPSKSTIVISSLVGAMFILITLLYSQNQKLQTQNHQLSESLTVTSDLNQKRLNELALASQDRVTREVANTTAKIRQQTAYQLFSLYNKPIETLRNSPQNPITPYNLNVNFRCDKTQNFTSFKTSPNEGSKDSEFAGNILSWCESIDQTKIFVATHNSGNIDLYPFDHTQNTPQIMYHSAQIYGKIAFDNTVQVVPIKWQTLNQKNYLNLDDKLIVKIIESTNYPQPKDLQVWNKNYQANTSMQSTYQWPAEYNQDEIIVAPQVRLIELCRIDENKHQTCSHLTTTTTPYYGK